MFDRVGVVGPIQEARMEAIHEAANISLFLKELPPLDVPRLWYSSVVQAGLDRIDVVVSEDRLKVPPQHTNRVTYRQHDVRKLHEIFYLVRLGLFGQQDPEKEVDEKRKKVMQKIEWFLNELIIATQRKQNMVLFDSIPTVQDVEGVLSADALIPVRNLLAAFEPINPVVVGVRSSVAARDVDLLEEIMASKVFHNYKSGHSGFDETSLAAQEAIKAIEKASRGVLDLHPAVLQSKRAVASLLPVTAKLIDVVCGKLPGILGDFFAGALVRWLNENRRVVVYQFPDLLGMTIDARMKDLMRKQGVEPGPTTEDENE